MVEHLKLGGQLVLTFPSLGTFDSLWRIDQEMAGGGLSAERRRLEAYLAERPSAADARGWLDRLHLSRIAVAEYPLEVTTGAGRHFSIIRCSGVVFLMMCTNVLRIKDWRMR